MTPLDPAAIRFHRQGQGPVVVLLHCLGVTDALWEPLAPLAERFTLLSYDFPGHGDAAPSPGAYTVEALADQLAARLRAESIGPVHLCGLSLGGLVAQAFAARHPALTGRVVLGDTTPRYPDEMRAMWVARAAAARRDGVASLVPGLLRIWFTEPFLAADPPAVQWVRATLSACDGEAYARACEALGAAELRPLLSDITAPALVICGTGESQAFRDAARLMAGTIPRARLEWVGPAGHCSVREQPVRWLAAVRAFLSA